MSSTIDLPLTKMIAVYLLALVPIAIIAKLKLKLVKDAVTSIIRMTIQLSLVGLYLKYIFDINSILLTTAWLIVMLVTTNIVTLKRSGLNRSFFFWPTLGSLTTSTILSSGVFILFVINPDPIYDARYLLPITGMLLGNTLRANIIALERFYTAARDRQEEHLSYLMLGATVEEAIRPHFQAAMKAAISPSIGSMATIGIVSLPGMMTGQILGGSIPVTAIKYQIAIMVCIFTVMTVASYLNISFTAKRAFDAFGILKTKSIFS